MTGISNDKVNELLRRGLSSSNCKYKALIIRVTYFSDWRNLDKLSKIIQQETWMNFRCSNTDLPIKLRVQLNRFTSIRKCTIQLMVVTTVVSSSLLSLAITNFHVPLLLKVKQQMLDGTYKSIGQRSQRDLQCIYRYLKNYTLCGITYAA